jgi:hypothetical protein
MTPPDPKDPRGIRKEIKENDFVKKQINEIEKYAADLGRAVDDDLILQWLEKTGGDIGDTY